VNLGRRNGFLPRTKLSWASLPLAARSATRALYSQRGGPLHDHTRLLHPAFDNSSCRVYSRETRASMGGMGPEMLASRRLTIRFNWSFRCATSLRATRSPSSAPWQASRCRQNVQRSAGESIPKTLCEMEPNSVAERSASALRNLVHDPIIYVLTT